MSAVVVPRTPANIAESKSLLENPTKIEDFFTNPEALVYSSPCFIKTPRYRQEWIEQNTHRLTGEEMESFYYTCVLYRDELTIVLFKHPESRTINVATYGSDAGVMCYDGPDLTPSDVGTFLKNM